MSNLIRGNAKIRLEKNEKAVSYFWTVTKCSVRKKRAEIKSVLNGKMMKPVFDVQCIQAIDLVTYIIVDSCWC